MRTDADLMSSSFPEEFIGVATLAVTDSLLPSPTPSPHPLLFLTHPPLMSKSVVYKCHYIYKY